MVTGKEGFTISAFKVSIIQHFRLATESIDESLRRRGFFDLDAVKFLKENFACVIWKVNTKRRE